MVSVPLNRVMTTLGSDGFTTKYEEYPVSNEDGNTNVFGATWMAMIFKANTGHTLNGLRLPLFKTGTPGNATISIQALSGGDPDGTDLSVVQFNGNSLLTTDPPAALTHITMPAVVLSVGVSYAIVIRVLLGSSGNVVHWMHDGSSPTYTDGNREASSDSGGTWTAQSEDMCFEEWGFA